ncbi:MAG: serine hydrolase [Alicyclobacillus sp.]|nr:serine hydrolase [Alicyclobacillus sp.]
MRPSFLGLQRHALWLLVVSGIFTLSVALSNTFVNVYLWKVDRTFGAIGWYNLCVYIALPLTFVVAGWLAKSYLHLNWTFRIGIGLHAAFYALALAGGTRIASLPWVLGAVMGTAGGFYWLSFNMLSMQFTERGMRDRFYGLNGVSGHAGLFSDVADLFRYMDIWRSGSGELISEQLRSAAIKPREESGTSSRGLGWECYGERVFGHTGFTGTSLWLYPEVDLQIVLLTNRVHFGRTDHILRLRPRLHNLIRSMF